MTSTRYDGLRTADELEAALREIGAERYHILHPFHRLLHSGKLDQGQVQAWALNRYYLPESHPDEGRGTDRPAVPTRRSAGSGRCALLDHDGTGDQEGGIVRWLRLCEGLGLDPAYVRSEEGILPATKFAVDAYVHFVRDRPLLEAIASSLPSCSRPRSTRSASPACSSGYAFVTEEMMAYFRRRLDQAPRDAGFALDYVRRHADTAEKRWPLPTR